MQEEKFVLPILVDPEKIKRIIDILLTNAIQYTPAGKEVQLHLAEVKEKDQNFFAITVRDNGIGIAPDDLPKIFTKFFRAQNAILMVPDGAGLGLYLAKAFVELHGGTIQVKSRLKEGSTFMVLLPMRLESLT